MPCGAMVPLFLGMKTFSAVAGYKARKQAAKLQKESAYAEAASLDRQAGYAEQSGLESIRGLREQEKIRSGQMKAAVGKTLRVAGSAQDAIDKYHQNVQKQVLDYGDKISQTAAELRYAASQTRAFGKANYKGSKRAALANLFGDSANIGWQAYQWYGVPKQETVIKAKKSSSKE